MATYQTYAGQSADIPHAPAHTNYENLEFYQTTQQHSASDLTQAAAGHDYFATHPLVYVSAPIPQLVNASHSDANVPMFLDHQPIHAHGLHESMIRNPELQDLMIVSPMHPPPATPYWHSPGPDTRHNSITTLNELQSPQATTQPYYSSLAAPWSPQSYNSGPPLASPPLSQASGGLVEIADAEPSSDHETRQSTDWLSDADADGEEDHDPCPSHYNTSQDGEQAKQRDPPTPISELTTAVSSSEDELMSDNDSEYRPRAAGPRDSTKKRRSGTSVRNAQHPRRSQVLAPTTGRVSSRKPQGRASKAKTNSWSRKSHASDSKCRPFHCPFASYGCLSTFPSKNEWKRHARTQHIQQYFWRCNLCDDDEEQGIYNDFNRKDLYEQHVQRMHRDVMEVDLSTLSSAVRHQLENNKLDKGTAKQYQTGKDRLRQDYWVSRFVLRQYEEQCKRHLRDLPDACGCPICNNKHFDGEGAWDDRMEHMSEHFEESRRYSDAVDAGTSPYHPANWHVDKELHGYLVHHKLISRHHEGGWRLLDLPSRRT